METYHKEGENNHSKTTPSANNALKIRVKEVM